MAGRRNIGGVVAPRPLLELIREPYYDTVGVVNGANTATFFANPLGQPDATAPTGVKTFTETNAVRAGALPTPQQYDIHGVTCWYETTNASLVNMQAFFNTGNFRLFIGTKEYLHTKLKDIPSGNALTGYSDAAVAPALWLTSGLQSPNSYYDVTIPEELLDATAQRTYLTGRKIPIHLPSEQNFNVTIDFPGTIALAPAPVRVTVSLVGIRKREVQ